MSYTINMNGENDVNAPPYVNFPLVRVKALRRVIVGGKLRHKLTALLAPIGYGKTVLMSLVFSELQRTGKQCVWICLNERHATLESIIDMIGLQLKLQAQETHPTGALLGGKASIEQRTDYLLNNLRSSPLPMAIFIDNLNYCSDAGINTLMNRLVFDSAPQIELVVSSIEDIPFNRTRAELEGLLLPLGPSDLRLERSEVEQIFPDDLKAKLGENGIQTVLDRTEGWPAAIRMIQIILERSSDVTQSLESISVSHSLLAELLNDEILSRLDDDLKSHLLELSLLHTFSTDLCQEIWSDPDSVKMLDSLIQRNILMVPLDSRSGWFRFHGLLREFLIAQAMKVIPCERRLDIYRRAALWSERNDLWQDAIEYSLEGEAFGHATDLLDRFAERAVRDSGHIAKFLRWTDILLKNQVSLAPQTEYWLIWAFAFRRQYDVAKRRVQKLRTRLGTTQVKSSATNYSKLRRRISLLQASIDSLTDNAAEAQREATDWLAEAQDGDDPFEVCAAHCIVGNSYTSQHCFTKARVALQSAKLSAFKANSVYVNGWVATYSNLITIAEGNYSEAYSDLIREITRTRSELPENSEITGALALVAAKCAVEMGLESEARELLKKGLPHLRTHGFLEVAACGLNAAVALWDGVSASPYDRQSLQEIANSYPPRLSLMLGCFITKRYLELGRVEEAAEEASRIGMHADLTDPGNLLSSDLPQMHDIFTITHADLLLTARNFEPAKLLIENGISRARAERRTAKLVNWLLLKTEYFSESQNIEAAKGSLLEAIRLATSRRIKLPFMVRSSRLAHIMNAIRTEHATLAHDTERHYFLELLESMGLELSTQGHQPLQSMKPQLLDRLTTRESDLLRLLSAGMSNEQIGNRLNISKTTVKWHLQNIYGKFDVKNRSTAVAHARVLGLIN
ncbi:MAG: LuxR C-terminal-related transcriptional regulator [Parasphingorhabdus sp.]|uniref:helix-turn-helix transcriptional regulator n=1 Tax=Parasphingorhabdus sp. TaxID=2709688 RepID=UPI003001EF79